MQPKRRLTVPDWRAHKAAGDRLSLVTAYEFTAALLVDQSPLDAILVGDSLGMVMLGYSGTTGVTMAEVLHHLRPVVKGAPNTFVIADMPFGSYNASIPEAIRNGSELIKAGADAVKLEGGLPLVETVRAMVQAGIPVMGHIGMTPQTAGALGGWKVQGRDAAVARELIEGAMALEAAGAFSIVLELVPTLLATHISGQLTIPTVGIGAGNGCDGQVLVWHDMFGLYDRIQPRFVKRYAEAGEAIKAGLAQYDEEVQSGAFPGPEHSFKMKPEELAAAIRGEQVLR
ncbi:MAG TPA: 3-methyl-2-oxobutanoate hydroxymethyltransferase [Symbiobacteriaceae bacterium]|nr:3-methyl-2-oxobutanoate hydroxymethyltransferase [Symbiobacteriaceae bacterium]